MQFSSFSFILLFFPVFFAGFFLLNKYAGNKAGKFWLIAAGAVFYVYAGLKAACVFAAGMFLTCVAAHGLSKSVKRRKAWLAAGIVINLAALFYFKYFNFFTDLANRLFGTDIAARKILLPLGISFITFQQIMYLVSVYKKEIEHHPLDYLAYVLYFPKLIMGPLAEPADIIRQINDPETKRPDWDHIAYGLRSFSFGLFKKAVLADTLSKVVTWAFGTLGETTSMDLILVMLCYTFQIYFDFSGYTDMAVGVSSMLNIRLPINFDSPYRSLSIREFWRRWHISLTKFLTKNIYIPLGGNKKGRVRTYLNMLIVFLVSGFWHGADLTFVVWGGIHGLISILERILERPLSKVFFVIRWIGTFLVVGILWLLYVCDSFSQWIGILKKMFRFQDLHISSGLLYSLSTPEKNLFFRLLNLDLLGARFDVLPVVIVLAASFAICLYPKNNYNNLKRNGIFWMIAAAAAFVLGFLNIGSSAVFIYNNF